MQFIEGVQFCNEIGCSAPPQFSILKRKEASERVRRRQEEDELHCSAPNISI